MIDKRQLKSVLKRILSSSSFFFTPKVGFEVCMSSYKAKLLHRIRLIFYFLNRQDELFVWILFLFFVPVWLKYVSSILLFISTRSWYCALPTILYPNLSKTKQNLQTLHSTGTKAINCAEFAKVVLIVNRFELIIVNWKPKAREPFPFLKRLDAKHKFHYSGGRCFPPASNNSLSKVEDSFEEFESPLTLFWWYFHLQSIKNWPNHTRHVKLVVLFFDGTDLRTPVFYLLEPIVVLELICWWLWKPSFWMSQ